MLQKKLSRRLVLELSFLIRLSKRNVIEIRVRVSAYNVCEPFREPLDELEPIHHLDDKVKLPSCADKAYEDQGPVTETSSGADGCFLRRFRDLLLRSRRRRADTPIKLRRLGTW